MAVALVATPGRISRVVSNQIRRDWPAYRGHPQALQEATRTARSRITLLEVFLLAFTSVLCFSKYPSQSRLIVVSRAFFLLVTCIRFLLAVGTPQGYKWLPIKSFFYT
jgi:hypothetical protein